ncbi:DDE-type integrase/transposase/recombinase [Nitratireductor indicus]|nr:DDE-type integrase/transposase/recombinase [Nitratireductor indicus]MDS1137802.1 DDE-type integrase/transposase/recombinase [Nitratireductor indicus]
MIFKGGHFDHSVIRLCVRWYLAYVLSLRDLKEMMAERGVSVDHSTNHCWLSTPRRCCCNDNRCKRSADCPWHMNETYIKVHGQWMCLCRAIDSVGDTFVRIRNSVRNQNGKTVMIYESLRLMMGRPQPS